MQSMLSERLKQRQQQSMERAKQQGARRKQLATQKIRGQNGSQATPAPDPTVCERPEGRKPNSRTRTRSKQHAGRVQPATGDASLEDAELQMALALSLEGASNSTAVEPVSVESRRRSHILNSVETRLALGSDAATEAYARCLQAHEDEQASRELISQLANLDRIEQATLRQRQRQMEAAAAVEQHLLMANMHAAPPAPSQDEIDMSYENLVKLSPVQVGLSAAARDQLPRFEVRKVTGMVQECPVCLAEWESLDMQVVQLVCGHCFHEECINQWLEEHTSCPVCKRVVDGERVAQ